jgi:rhodanese-related sulfurtransferase
MKELNKTKRLTIAAVTIAAVFIVGLLTLNRPEVIYKLSPEVMLSKLNNPEFNLNTTQIQELIKNDNSTTVFIDIRNPIDFSKNHINKAINIPLRELFEHQNLNMLHKLEEKQMVVIYGESSRHTNGAWMMLQQTGFKNIKMYSGNFDEIIGKVVPSIASEIPVIDMEELKKISSPTTVTTGNNDSSPKKTVNPQKLEPKSGGGC